MHKLSNVLVFLFLISTQNVMASENNHEKLLKKLDLSIPMELQTSLMIDIFGDKMVKDKNNWNGHPDFLWGYYNMDSGMHTLYLFYKRYVAGALIHTCEGSYTTFQMYAQGSKSYKISNNSKHYIQKTYCK